MSKKQIIDKSTFLEDFSKNIVPRYLGITPNDSLQSVFGVITQTMANSVDDTYKLNLARNTDSILELSNNIIKLRMAASIARLDIARATPAKTMGTLSIATDDIIQKGKIQPNGDIHFNIDKRSEITHSDINFSLPDTIVIRAVRSNTTGYFYTAEYMELDPSSNIINLQKVIAEGVEILQLTTVVYQYKINSAQKNIMDALGFSTEGVLFEYSDKLAGFDVYYKRSVIEDFKKVDLAYYITDTLGDNMLRFNDDRDAEIYILNNYNMELPENTIIRVDIKETLGTYGHISLGQSSTEFHLFQDDDYGMMSVNIDIILLLDPVGGAEADDVNAIQQKLIRKKFEREAIITDQDARNFIGSVFNNTQLINRRNDFKSKERNVYTLLQNNGAIAPTTTLNLKIFQDEFDIFHNISGRRILKSNSAYKLTDIPNSGVSKIPIPATANDLATLENNKDQMCLAFPFVLAVTTDPICKIFMNTIQETLNVQSVYQNENSKLKYAVREIKFERNSMSTEYDKYKVNLVLIPNSIGDTGLLDDNGEIIPNKLKTFIVFKSEGIKKAYLPLAIDSIDVIKNVIHLSGEFKTDDYITEDLKLKITSNLVLAGEVSPSEIVIDYLQSEFDVVSFCKESPSDASNEFYSIIPGLDSLYTITNVSTNKDNKLDLLIDMNAFMNCNIRVIQEDVSGTIKTGYLISEIPFIKYSYCKDNIFSVLSQIKVMKTLYLELGAKLVDKTLNLKFTRTYGRSKYIKVGLNNQDLANINPVFKFRIYGEFTSYQEIRSFIKAYFDTINDIDKGIIHLSNVCREIENQFGVESCICTGIDNFTETNLMIKYEKPDKETTPEMYSAYIPEYLCIGNIDIITDSNTI